MPAGTSRYDEARLQQRLWTPAELGKATVKSWWDSAALNTVTAASSLVSQWNDISGNARNATQGTGANQPTLLSTPLRGMLFTRTTDVFSISSVGTTYDMYLVGVPQAGAAFLGIQSNATHTPFLVDQTTDGIGLFDGAIKLASGLLWTRGVRKVGSMSLQSASNASYGLNGSALVAPAAHNLSSPTPTTLGNVPAANEQFGTIYEALFTTNLSARNRAQVEGYLGWKWNVPLVGSHRYARQPPLKGT